MHPRVSSLRSLRSFWKNKGRDNEGEEASTELSVVAQSLKSLMDHTGDKAPAINPLIILPNPKRPLFPGTPFLLKALVTDEAMIAALGNPGSYAGVFLRKADQDDSHSETSGLITNPNEIYATGTLAQVMFAQRGDDGVVLSLHGHRRISLEEITSLGPPVMGKVQYWKKPAATGHSPLIKAYVNELQALFFDHVQQDRRLLIEASLVYAKIDVNDPTRLVDLVATTALQSADGHELQKLLENPDIEQRLQLCLSLLNNEKNITILQKDIRQQVDDKVSKANREFFLKEQMKTIKKELGLEREDKDDLTAKFHEKLDAIRARPKAPAEVIKIIEDEIKHLEEIERMSAEFNVVRSYLDWLTAVPWGLFHQDTLELKSASRILNEDHFGLDDIKTRILEFIAVGKLTGTITGKILCFIGPPGVGKTSIGKSVARALDRPFYRFSVGGLTDAAEIKGHRRTYIGAMPGKPVQCVKLTGAMNPVLLIDEIDKLGRHYGHSGDPSSMLLELLDPSQNNAFLDHYLDTPIDFSQVLFICTANDESSIPGPLKDRMEVIRLSGYDIPEKVQIAMRYLLPKLLKANGLDQDDVLLPEDSVEAIIRGYCRESGVRNLEKTIDKIIRKVVFQKVQAAENATSTSTASAEVPEAAAEVIMNAETVSSPAEEVLAEPVHAEVLVSTPEEVPAAVVVPSPPKEVLVIQPGDLEKYIGQRKFQDETIYSLTEEQAPGVPGTLPPGIVMGLAWDPLGGSPIFIETVALPVEQASGSPAHGGGGGGIRMVTGQLGDVMKESTSIAYTFARKFLKDVDPGNVFFSTHSVHMHVPEGAVSKDGPSAGIAMASSLMSLASNTSLRPRVAMTGELSLTGKVLPIGGVKEKVLAAKRSGAVTILLPANNKRDYDELPAYVKEAVDVRFVKEYKEVFDIIFPQKQQQEVVKEGKEVEGVDLLVPH